MDRLPGGITFGLTDRQFMQLTYGQTYHVTDGMAAGDSPESCILCNISFEYSGGSSVYTCIGII